MILSFATASFLNTTIGADNLVALFMASKVVINTTAVGGIMEKAVSNIVMAAVGEEARYISITFVQNAIVKNIAAVGVIDRMGYVSEIN